LKPIDTVTAALRHVGAAAAAPVQQLAGPAHQGVHIAGSIRGTREDEARSFRVARAQERYRTWVRDDG
jgi:hypothetical protein